MKSSKLRNETIQHVHTSNEFMRLFGEYDNDGYTLYWTERKMAENFAFYFEWEIWSRRMGTQRERSKADRSNGSLLKIVLSPRSWRVTVSIYNTLLLPNALIAEKTTHDWTRRIQFHGQPNDVQYITEKLDAYIAGRPFGGRAPKCGIVELPQRASGENKRNFSQNRRMITSNKGKT